MLPALKAFALPFVVFLVIYLSLMLYAWLARRRARLEAARRDSDAGDTHLLIAESGPDPFDDMPPIAAGAIRPSADDDYGVKPLSKDEASILRAYWRDMVLNAPIERAHLITPYWRKQYDLPQPVDRYEAAAECEMANPGDGFDFRASRQAGLALHSEAL